MNRFAKFHPLISFSFFITVIVATIVFTNSFFVFISFIFSFLYSFKLFGKNAIKNLISFAIPIALLSAIFNFIFAHYGKIIFFTVKGINFTYECLLSGLFTGIMISAVFLWFLCYNEIITSDKFMSLFGRFFPNLALLFSMILRFIPLMIKTSNEIKEAQIGLGIENKGVKNLLSRFSVLISISLEKSIDTADSMKARGFGSGRRKHFSSFDFRLRDSISGVIIIILFIFVLYFAIVDYPQIVFSPTIQVKSINYMVLVVFAIYSAFPLIVDITGDLKWHLLRSKI